MLKCVYQVISIYNIIPIKDMFNDKKNLKMLQKIVDMF